MIEQCKKWEELKYNFNSFINKEYKNEPFDFGKIYSIVESYRNKFENLPIHGKLYVKVNKRLLIGQLIKIIQDIEYLEVKETENPNCECQILSQFNKFPKDKNLKEIGVINDNYYMPKLYECNKCGFKWISYISDDSLGQIIYEKYDPNDADLVKYFK